MRISDWSSDVCSSDLGASMTPRPTDRRTASLMHLFHSKAATMAPRSHRAWSMLVSRRRANYCHRNRASGSHAPASEHHSMTDERSEEHTSELQSPMPNSYAVVCLK